MVDSSDQVRALLSEAISRAGSQAKLAKLLIPEVSQVLISKALAQGRVSARLAAALHQWSRGRFSKHELRPDIFGQPRRRRNEAAE